MAPGKLKVSLTLRPLDRAFAGFARALSVAAPIIGDESLSASRPSISNLVPRMEWETTGRSPTKKSLLITIRSNLISGFSAARKIFLAHPTAYSCRLRNRAARKHWFRKHAPRQKYFASRRAGQSLPSRLMVVRRATIALSVAGDALRL